MVILLWALPMTGFTETVQLGEIGDILESTEHVMSVGVVDRQTGDRVDVAELSREWGDPEPMFRGTVMVAGGATSSSTSIATGSSSSSSSSSAAGRTSVSIGGWRVVEEEAVAV